MNFASQLAQQFGPPLRDRGYRRKNHNWTKANSDITLIVNIQQSRWGNWAYINCGIYIHKLGTALTPKEYDCQIRFRLEAVVPGQAGKLIQGDDHSFPSVSPREPTETDAINFAKALVDFGLPFLDRFEEISKLRELIVSRIAGSDDQVCQFTRQLNDDQINIVQAMQ